MEKLNIAFLGGRVLGYKCLEILAEYTKTVNVEFIIAHKKDGETNSDWNPSILPLAIDLGFKVLEPPSLKTDSVFELFNDRNINLILNAFCNRIIPKKILDIAKYGAINFHYGKLPKYKGRFIVTHIILNGEKETCATAHFMTEDIDAGDIIYEEPVKILPNDTAMSLYFRCTEAALKLFRKVLDTLISGKSLPRRKQVQQGVYYPFEEPNNGKVELNWDRQKIERFIRATTFPTISKPRIEIEDLIFDVILRK